MDELILDPQQPKQLSKWQMRTIVLAFILFAGVVAWMLWSQFSWQLASLGRVKTVAEIDQTAFTEETGVKVTLVAVTASGGMIDLRFQVADPDKAIIVHDDERPPTIIDERTGKVITRPWHEHGDTDFHSAIIYYVLLMNPDGIIEPGSIVTIQIGDMTLEHVRVQ